MSEKKMTEEREMKIMERTVAIMGELGCVANTAGNLRALVAKLRHFEQKRAEPEDVYEAWRAEVLHVLGAAQVGLNMLELIFGDCTDGEIAQLDYLDGLVREQVAAVVDAAREIDADLAAEESEEQDAE